MEYSAKKCNTLAVSHEEESAIFIPARMASTRLPGKPLLDIHGLPMIIRVARSCVEAVGSGRVFVLSPDDVIIDTCKKHGVEAIKTSSKCQNGTERIAEIAKTMNWSRFINIQGDEPLLNADIIKEFIRKSARIPGTAIAFSYLVDKKLIESSSVVKIVTSQERVIYCSRLPISSKESNEQITYKKHLGMYSYTKDDLLIYQNSPAGSLELTESVEILRLLENHRMVYAIESTIFGRSVDTYDDYEFILRYGKFSES